MDELIKALKTIEEFCGKNSCGECKLGQLCDEEFINQPIDWEISEVE